MLIKDEIIKVCLDNLPKFKEIIQEMRFENKGIFNSEMLLFISLVNYFGVNLIIESGRARGYSTQIIAEFFKKVIIDKHDPKKIREEVAEFRKDFNEVKYCFQTPNKAYEYIKLF